MDRAIHDELDKSGLPWVITRGTKHQKIYLRGRLVGILPNDNKRGSERAIRNTVAQIRRAVQSILSGGQSCS